MRKINFLKTMLYVGMLFSSCLIAQQSYTFTPCGASGSVGPSQTQVNNTYSNTNLVGAVGTITNGIQTWTVPYTGNFRIEARGAQGGGSGGLGATMAGDFSLTAGEVIRILVGQVGVNGGSGPSGGGGGSFVVRTPYTTTASILVIAGGGSGAGNYSFTPGVSTSTGVTGGVGGGVNGSGGSGGTRGAGGGGFLTDGSPCSVNTNYASPGRAFVNGGAGGFPTNNCSFTAAGGFGGGSSHGGNCINNGGAGGGYSGGGGSSNTTAGGGGSLNNGTNQNNASAANSGDGRVIITELCSVQIYASGSSSTAPYVCAGNSLTLTTNAVSNFSWSNGSNASFIVVSPSVATAYSLVATTSVACSAVGNITVNVNSSAPSLTVSNPSVSVCPGQAATLTATGANTYTWLNAGVVNGQTFAPVSTQVYTVQGQNGCGITTATTAITVQPLPVTVSANPTLVCEGKPSTLTAVAAANIYSWMPGNLTTQSVIVSPTANTVYTVTASDGTCYGTFTIQLNTKLTPTVSVATTASLICRGETVTLTASGADTYSWTPGNLTGSLITVSPNTASLYVVTGENTVNCTAMNQQVVVVQATPTISILASQTLVCNGETATLTANGGNGYQWNNGPATAVHIVTPGISSVYTVTGAHNTNTCTETKTIELASFTPSLSLPSNTSVCAGKSITLTANGADDYTWNGFSSGNTGTFALQPTSDNTVTLVATSMSLNVTCPVTHTFEVKLNPLPNVSVTASPSVICRNESSTLTASGASTYVWADSQTLSAVVITPSVTNNYSVTGIDGNGCEKKVGVQVKVNACVGIDEVVGRETLVQVYPNPAKESFVIKSETALAVWVYNNLGQVVLNTNLNAANNYQVEVKHLSPGVYFVTAEGQGSKKVIVE